MNERILSELQTLIEKEFEDFSDDLGKTEMAVKALMASLGKSLLQRLINRGPNGYKGSSVACECGGSMRFVQHRSKDIHTLFGWIETERAYYHCPDCGKSVFPYDLFGQTVSDTTIERVVMHIGSVALKQQDQELDNFLSDRQLSGADFTPERLYVTTDGTTVHENDGWHECKVGTIYFEDERKGRKSCYIGRFDSSETFGWYLWLAGCRLGLCEAQEVVYIGDGAGWIRNEHHRHFGRATFIIDWYHASEHVWDCGKILFGEGSKLTERWVNQHLDLLWNGWTKKVLDDLSQIRKVHRGGKREAVDALIRYVSTNEEQMRYDVFRSKGYDIGSGAVEGACKHVIGKRLKQSGMIWKRSGSSATLALRITWLNDDWEQLWKSKPLAA